MKGFTVVELLIVIVVIGVLAGITIVSYQGVTNSTKIASAQHDLEVLKKAMLSYRVKNGTLPPGGDFYSGTAVPPPSTWVSTVVTSMKNAGVLNVSGNKLETDPWGFYYWYDNNDCSFGQGGTSPLMSVGPDGTRGTSDDISISIVTYC